MFPVTRPVRQGLATFAVVAFTIVPTGYVEPASFMAGSPYGASHVAGQNATPPNEHEAAVARYQGKRVAQVAKALKAAK